MWTSTPKNAARRESDAPRTHPSRSAGPRLGALGLLLLLCSGPLSATASPARNDLGDDPEAEESAFLEWSTDRTTYVVHEEIELTLRMGFENELASSRLIPLFHRPLDLSVQVQAPWLTELADRGLQTISSDEEPRTPAPTTFALDDDVATAFRVADETVSGAAGEARSFRVYEWRRRLRADTPGRIELPAPLLRFAYATSFREDFLGDRIAEDRHDVTIQGAPLAFLVEPLPEEGRPSSFGGAVGRFRVSASAEPRDLAVGDVLRVTFEIEGEGNLETLEPPTLEELIGFEVLGTLPETSATGRRVQYDVVPKHVDLSAFPPIELTYYAPEEKSYRTVRSEPIPLLVRPEASRSVDAREVENAGANAPATSAPAEGESNASGRWPLYLGLGALAVAAVALGRRRSGGSTTTDNSVAPAARRFEEELGNDDANLLEFLDDFLGALLACPPTAIHGQNILSRLRAANVPEDLAQRTQSLLDRLHGERYGGGVAEDARGTARQLVRELEQARSAKG